MERLFGVEANEGDDLALEFDRGTGLGKYRARRSGWSFSTTILCGLLVLIDRPLGIKGAPGVMEGVDIMVAWLSCGQGCDTSRLAVETEELLKKLELGFLSFGERNLRILTPAGPKNQLSRQLSTIIQTMMPNPLEVMGRLPIPMM